MTPTLHLEGMGLVGCMTALRLLDDGYDFTWHDTEEPRVQSWRASTGAIMPFGDDLSMENLEAWLALLRAGNTRFSRVLRPHMTKSRFCYYSTNPPHKGRQQGVEALHEVGPIKVSNKHALNMDPQSVVERTRGVLRRNRTDGPAPDQVVLVTHGWHEDTIGSWSWGWSAQVKVGMDPKVEARLQDTKGVGTFYLRNGYQLCYLYPIGRRARAGWYYAGTTLITQKRKPKSLPIEPKYLTWMDQLASNSGGLLWVERLEADSLMEAWRPMPKEGLDLITIDDSAHPNVHLYIRPQYGNGIRMFPSTYDALAEVLSGIDLEV